jgi:hypothetical protein
MTSMKGDASGSLPRGAGLRSNRRVNESHSSVVENTIKLMRSKKKKVAAILRKGKIFRSGDDIEFLANHFKDFKAFLNVSDFLLRQLCVCFQSILTQGNYDLD